MTYCREFPPKKKKTSKNEVWFYNNCIIFIILFFINISWGTGVNKKLLYQLMSDNYFKIGLNKKKYILLTTKILLGKK